MDDHKLQQQQQSLLSDFLYNQNDYNSSLYITEQSPPQEELIWIDDNSNESCLTEQYHPIANTWAEQSQPNLGVGGYHYNILEDNLMNIPTNQPTTNPLPINDPREDHQIVPIIETTNTPPANFPINIEYKIFPEVIPKYQKRVKGKSEQRIKNGKLSFVLDFQDIITFQLIYFIHVFVKRTNEVYGTPQFIGPVNLKPKFELINDTKYLVTVELDSIYEVNGKKVYELQKTLTDELNKYHLIIEIQLQDNRTANIKTKEFLLLGKETEKKPPEKKARRQSNSSDENFYPSPPPGSSPSSGYGSGEDQEDVKRFRKIVADHVQTKSLDIDGILISNTPIQSPNGDIAYHFTLENSNDFFEEGEIVGLFTNKSENKQTLVKLTSKNAAEIILKGVITRSQYFEAMKPPPGVKSEIICMMGIIPVKVQGTVLPNEPLYASPKVPGVAISGQYLNSEQMKDAALIGYSFQSRSPQDEDRVGMIQAGVSVLNSASQTLLNQRIRSIEQHWLGQIRNLKSANKRFRKYFQLVSFGSLVTLILLGVLLWQLLFPGSALRYYQCKHDSLPGKTSSFLLKKDKPIFDNYVVNGIQFKFKTLLKKINAEQTFTTMKEIDTRYYLNIDRCAFGGERSTKDDITGATRVAGPSVFAMNKNCTKVYSYQEFQKGWAEIGFNNKHISTTNLKCTPPPP